MGKNGVPHGKGILTKNETKLEGNWINGDFEFPK